MICSKCGRQNEEGNKFCSSCGTILSLEISKDTQNTTVVYAGVGKRVVAFIMDCVLSFGGIGYGVGVVTGNVTSTGFSLSGGSAFLAFFLIFAYFAGFEACFGATPGKMILKIKVTQRDGSKCDITAAILRNILLFADAQFFGLVGIILILKAKHKQRLGDLIAKTVVIQQ